jgi:hypothetical protein
VKIVVGLVTHPASRFNADGVASAQTELIAAALGAQGEDVEILISDRDDYDAEAYPLNGEQRLASARAQVDLERRWRSYVCNLAGHDGQGPREQIIAFGSTIRRGLAALHVPGTGTDTSRAGLIRLINIDLSHIRIWRHAVHVGADVALVLEDDARLSSAEGPTDVLALLRALPQEVPGFAVMSESLGLNDLGVTSILDRSPVTDGIRRLRSPLTNTVCANAYNAPLLRSLVAVITPGSLIPVLPIDWRLNAYLLDHPDTRCIWAAKPPFLQASMLFQ